MRKQWEAVRADWYGNEPKVLLRNWSHWTD